MLRQSFFKDNFLGYTIGEHAGKVLIFSHSPEPVIPQASHSMTIRETVTCKFSVFITMDSSGRGHVLSHTMTIT